MYDKPTCRLCLSSEGNLEEIFDSFDLSQKIFECTNIEIKHIKGLPSCICEICKSEIIIWLKFKKQCLKTNDFLQSKYPELFLESTNSIEDKLECNPLENSRDDEENNYLNDHIRDEGSEDEEVKDIEYIDDLDYSNSYKIDEEYTDDEEVSVSRGAKIVDVKFEKLLDDDLIEEELLQNDDTIEVVSVKDDANFHIESRRRTNADIKENDIKELGQRAKSKCGEVWKIKDGKRIKYHTKCEICGKLQQNIKQHMLIHSNELPFKCPYCQRGFRQKSNFKHHIYIHTGEKPYKCKVCNKAFSDPASVRSHMIQHTGERRYHCEICGKAFGHSHTLVAHKRIHTQDRRHNCDHCSKKFLSKHALKKHIRTHTGERPYQCDQCPKNFSTSGNLSTHKRIHTKERPYQCQVCGLDFAYKCVLNTHMNRHTGKNKSNCNEDDDNDDDVSDEIVYKIEFNINQD